MAFIRDTIKPQDIGNFKSLSQKNNYEMAKRLIDPVEQRGTELIEFDNDTVDINKAEGNVIVTDYKKHIDEHVIYDVNTKEIKHFETNNEYMADKEVKKGFLGLGHEKAIYKLRNETATVDKKTGAITYEWESYGT